MMSAHAKGVDEPLRPFTVTADKFKFQVSHHSSFSRMAQAPIFVFVINNSTL